MSANLEVILEKINNLTDMSFQAHEQMNEHLKELNGQVTKNTQFRIQGKVYFKILYFLLAMVIVPVVLMFFNIQIAN